MKSSVAVLGYCQCLIFQVWMEIWERGRTVVSTPSAPTLSTPAVGLPPPRCREILPIRF